MALKKDTVSIQHSLGTYCRTGDEKALINVPGITPNRVDQYRRLVSNIIVDNITASYPIANKILGEELWSEIALDFFKTHKCQSTQVWQLPKEFASYIISEREDLHKKHPFLPDLITFEWTEMEVFGMPDLALPDAQAINSWSNVSHGLAINPEHQLLQLTYPVFKTTQLDELVPNGPYYLLVFREPKNLKARFFELSPVYVFIFQQCLEGITLAASISLLEQQLGNSLSDDQHSKLLATLDKLYQRGAILGFTPEP